VERLPGRLQHYDWGSSTALADLRGAEPSGLPEAELWFGAHRARSSEVVDGRAPEGVDLPDVAYLPYLVKLLAADRPLSLQVHPDAMAAADGYRREEEAGIGRGDATRSFPDPGPKPELLCAVTRFEALCGFRPVPEAREVAGAHPDPAG
jgi:mannose-6-phosphate isomerase